MSDQMTAYSNSLRKFVKCYRKLVFELITGTSVVNALHLYNKVNDKKLSITTFKENLCMQLLENGRPPIPENIPQDHKLSQRAKNKRGRVNIATKKTHKSMAVIML